MKRFRLIFAAIITVLVLIVVLQNTESVETKLLFMSFSMPRALLLFVTFLCGGVTGLLFAVQLWGRKGKAGKGK